jgi:hypothetical protein
VEKNRVLFAHAPEPNLCYGGRAGWKRTGFFSHTHRSQSHFLWWKGGVEKNRVLFAHAPEPKSFFMVEGRGGKEQGSCRTRTGAKVIFMVEGQGGKEQGSFRTRTGAKVILWWKGGVEKNRVLFAHAPEPNFNVWRGGKEQCSFRTRTGAKFCLWGKGGRTGWERTVFFLHTYRSQIKF